MLNYSPGERLRRSIKPALQGLLQKTPVMKRPFFKKKAVLGLDIGSGSIKAVRLEELESGIRLTHFDFKEFSPEETDRDGFIAKAMEGIAHTMGDGITRCTSCISGPNTSTSLITFPRMPEKELVSALKLRLGETLPFDLNSAAFDFYVQKREDEGQVCVLAAASQKEVIDQKVALIEKEGVELAGIGVIPSAWENLIERADLALEEASLLLDIGSNVTNILIFASGTLRYCRELATGGNQVTMSIVGPVVSEEGRKDLDLKEAERIKRRYGIPKGDEIERYETQLPSAQISAKIRPVLERLTVEIKRSISLYQQASKGKEVRRILICGGGSRLKNIETFLAEALGIKVERFDPLRYIDIGLAVPDKARLSELSPQLGVALGLALDTGKKINLLPLDLKLRPLAYRINRISRIILILMVLTILLLSIGMQRNIFTHRRLLSDNKASLRPLTSTVIRMNELKVLKERLDKRSIFLQGLVRRGPLWDGILKEISNIIPEGVLLEELSLEKASGAVQLKGRIFGPGKDNVLAQFMVALDESPFFDGIELVSTGKAPGGESMSFQINCSLIY